MGTIACRALATVSIAAMASIVGPSFAFAQQVAAANGSGGVEEVLVTATRRATKEENLGVSLTALSQEDLKLQAPHTLQDLSGAAPNVFIGMDTAGPGASAIYIRGQGYADIEKTQTTPVGVVVDGVVFGTSTGQLLDMFDVCSVEVDEGPQGLFYGQNTSAGLVNITRCAPTRQFGAEVSAGYGSYNDEYLRAVLNAPLGDNGGIKISGQWHSNDGYYKDVYTGSNVGGERYTAIHAVIDYDLASWLNANLSFDHMHDHGGGTPVQFGDALTANILSGGNPSAIWPNYNPKTGSPDGLQPWQVENRPGGDWDKFKNDIYSLVLKAKSPIGDIMFQTAYMDEADDVGQDFDGTCFVAPGTPGPGCNSVGNPLLASAGNYLETGRYQTYKQFTQELHVTGTVFDQFDYLFGVFYDHNDITLHQNTNVVIDQWSSQGDSSWAYFGNVDWNPTDTIKLSAGARQIDESKRFGTYYQLELFGGVPITPHIADNHSWHKAITRLSAQWQATPDNLLYATRSEGFRSGGFSIRGTLAEDAPGQSNYAPGNNFLGFLPETDVNYEIGSKNEFFDHALLFNVDGFITNISDVQQSQVVETPGYGPGTDTYIVNYPKVQIKGLEFQLNARVGRFIQAFDGLTLTANYGVQSANVKNGVVNGEEVALGAGATAGVPGSVADFTGSTLTRVPGNSFTIRGTYAREVMPDATLTFSAGYSWLSHFSLANFGTAQDYQPGYGLVDASIRLDYRNYYISVYGKNLGDTAYRDQSLATVFFQGWGAPRTVNVEIGAKF
jgi:iron complex outermembrane receptor protein